MSNFQKFEFCSFFPLLILCILCIRMRKKTFLNSQNCTALPDVGNTYCISISLTIISSAKFQFEPQIVTNIMQISSILGIKPVGPYERILRLRHSFILSFFHVRSHSNEGIFGSFPGSSIVRSSEKTITVFRQFQDKTAALPRTDSNWRARVLYSRVCEKCTG